MGDAVSVNAEPLRRLGDSSLFVAPIAMGCWPIAGVTSIDVNEEHSVATLEAALEAGINFFDTAHVYGYEGESERLLGRVFAGRRRQAVLATKGGIHWENKVQIKDGSPVRLRWECEESLRRLQTDYIDLLYLHFPDPNVPIGESAGELRRLLEEGKTRAVGVSNVDAHGLAEFAVECPLTAYQPAYNMLQREIEASELPWCRAHNVAVAVYWPLMKGLLAGRLPRDHVFDPRDGRAKYPIYRGREWERNQDFVDRVRAVAIEAGKTVAQVALNWTIQRQGVTAALAGAKRPAQIRENAAAMGWRLDPDQLAALDKAIADRGPVDNRNPGASSTGGADVKPNDRDGN